jgi:hypothetical protein
MTTAQELLDNPGLGIDPITASASAYSDDELRHFHIGENDIQKILLKIYNFDGSGKKSITEDVRTVVLDAEFEDSIDATPTFTLTLHDPDWELLNTGALDHTIDINPGGLPRRWYRLNTVNVSDNTITLVFITRNAAYLSFHTKPYKISRSKMTRAQFILTMLNHVKKKGVKIKLFCPELEKKQPIAKTKPASKKSKDERRRPGFESDEKLEVMSNAGEVRIADFSQLKVMEEALEGAVDVGVSPRGMVAGLMVIMIETDTGKARNANPKYKGVFQQDPRYWPATGDVYKDGVGANGKTGFWPRLKEYLAEHPDSDLGEAGRAVQNPGDPTYGMKLNRARPYADKAVKAYTGGGGADDVTWAKKYEFMIGPPDGPRGENYLAVTHRLAEEVNWRAYWVRDVLHYISDKDLFAAKARARLRRYENGVESVSFGWDRGKKLNNMIIRVRMKKWFAPIGTVVIFDEGGPARGRWLVTNIRRSMFDTLGEVTLSKPINEKKEPAHEMGSRPKDGGDTNPSTPADHDGTPKDIIDNVVIPIAQRIGTFQAGGGQGFLTPESVDKANAPRRGGRTKGGSPSDHGGPPEERWAADISDNWAATNGTPLMDELAEALAKEFGLPKAWGNNKCYSVVKGDYRYNICYKMNDDQAGNHFDHVHFGVKYIGPGFPDRRGQKNEPPPGDS